jgi:Ca2+-binding RTX toxin-like protein
MVKKPVWAVVLPILAGVALAVAPGSASATLTISYAPGTGALVQGDGASEGISLGNPFGPIRFLPASVPGIQPATLVAGPGCTAGTGASPASPAGSVSCTQSGSGVVTANLGAGNDRIFSSGYSGDQFLFGEDGNDRLSGGGGFDLVDGGAGDDQLGSDSGGTNTLLGKDGNDVFLASQTGSADRFDGGAGTDVGDYSARSAAVSLKVTVGTTGSNDDGAAGESDGLESVETLIGGSAADVLEFRSVLRSSPAGTRTLTGNAGADTLRAIGAVTTAMDGGLGQDNVSGGLGVDSIFAREGEKDTITCGGSLDTLKPDLRDTPVSADCENIDQSDRREGPNVAFRTRLARVDGDGALSVRLACPRSVRIGCRGGLSARLDRRGTRFGGSDSYSLRPGRSATLEVGLPTGQVAAARRPGARVRVRSVERGVHGPKTTQRSLPGRRA